MTVVTFLVIICYYMMSQLVMALYIDKFMYGKLMLDAFNHVNSKGMMDWFLNTMSSLKIIILHNVKRSSML